jgi:hypothetical protein
MGVDIAVLQETKFDDKTYTKAASGYTIMCSKAVSIRQGGVGILWKEGDLRFKVESVAFRNGTNIVTFQSPETVNTTSWGRTYHPHVTLGWMKFVWR